MELVAFVHPPPLPEPPLAPQSAAAVVTTPPVVVRKHRPSRRPVKARLLAIVILVEATFVEETTAPLIKSMPPLAFRSKRLFELVPWVNPLSVAALMANPEETIGWRGERVSKAELVVFQTLI